MPRLGDGLPPEKRREYILGKMIPGCVLRLPVKFPETTKPKFLVLVAEDNPEDWAFIVNSKIHPYVLSRPHLNRCQVKLAAASHPFLRHDSYLACDKVVRLRREEVLAALMADTSGIQGEIPTSVRDQIVAAVKLAVTLSGVEKTRIIAALNDATGVQ